MAREVSVVVPTRGDSPYLRAALASALDNPETGELLIVHDRRPAGPPLGSSDPGQDPRVRSIESPAPGVSAARNAGLDAARGHWVAFLDDDDLWDRDHLGRALETLARYPQAVLACCDARVFVDPTVDGSAVPPEEGRGLPLKSPDLADGPIPLARLLAGNPIVTPSVVLVRSQLAPQDRFDPALGHLEDYDLWLRLARDRSLVFDRHPSVTIRRRPASASRDRRAMAEGSLEVLRRAQRDLPQAALSPGALRAREAQVWHELAYACLAEGDVPAARAAVLEAIRRRPLRLKNYLYLAACLWPAGARRVGRGR
jgi:glycosyltransferase involved in cell wall biosynthesis